MARLLDPIPLGPPAGIVRKDSMRASAGRWIDMDKTRFLDKKPEKIGGWNVLTETAVDAVRSCFAWNDNALQPYIAVGTHRKLYVVDLTNEPSDITPIEETGTLTDPFSTTDTSAVVNVEDTAHGRTVGDEVRFDGASAVGGITIDGTYTVTEIVDPDNYTITHSAPATSTAGPGGGSVDYEYELGIGADDPAFGAGYGSGGYGEGTYGTPRDSSTIVFEPRLWSFDNYGQLLLANPVNRGIFVFDPTDTPAYVRAEALSGAPEVCRAMFVTPERYVFALGVDNDPMTMKWPDLNDFTNWTPGTGNTAGSRRLQIGTRIMGGVAIGNGLSAVLTDTAFYRFQYTGSSFVYDSKMLGTNAGLVSPAAIVSYRLVAYWMSFNDFLMFDGAVRSIPNSGDIQNWFFGMLRGSGYEYKAWVFLNAEFNEVWFFAVATGETDAGYYAAVSLDDFSWITGTMERNCGTLLKSADQQPVMGASDGFLYTHEDGLDADGEILEAYITLGPLQLLEGGRLGDVTGFVPDFERQTGNLSVEVTAYDRINQTALETETQTFDDEESPVDLAVSGRHVVLTIRSAELGGDFRLGLPTLEVSSTGRQR